MTLALPVRLVNSSNLVKSDWWSWSVWVEGKDDALDQIESVRYTLHHTFPDPFKVVRSRHTKFALASSG